MSRAGDGLRMSVRLLERQVAMSSTSASLFLAALPRQWTTVVLSKCTQAMFSTSLPDMTVGSLAMLPTFRCICLEPANTRAPRKPRHERRSRVNPGCLMSQLLHIFHIRSRIDQRLAFGSCLAAEFKNARAQTAQEHAGVPH